MASTTVHLPNGQTIAVSPVYGGFFFKPNDLHTHHTVLPPGWTIQIHTEDDETDHDVSWRGHSAQVSSSSSAGSVPEVSARRQHAHRFRTATLRSDGLFISSISNPSSTDFKPASSPTRQIAMMLWATLYWYFHHPEPDARLTTAASAKTAETGRPRGDWRVVVKREGVLRGRNLLQKLERMGLIASEDSCVGTETDERTGEGWQDMFISRRSFWQLDARIFLFTLTPASHSPYPAGSPPSSRPGSPGGGASTPRPENQAEARALASSQGLWAPSVSGPFASGSHLPTYFPPPPLQYTFTGGVRHPMRPKPPRQGETFYTRFVPSVGQYLSFRVASISAKPPAHLGPISPSQGRFSRPTSTSSDMSVTVRGPLNPGPNDVELLHAWMNDARVAHFWGEQGAQSHQEDFLRAGLRSKHSFPVIGCWDGRPFGYFEIYWVKEDRLGRHVDGGGDNYDRGVHGLVGEQEFRGAHRVRVWLSALVHHCFLADSRTQSVLMEPRVDNERFIKYLHEAGFHREKEVAFPHKQSALMRVRREAWEAPSL
ncbi:MAG: hypothetical protein M1832_005411 [Thelocarpon impressellum]|nr:MAG: hypothetical protein M1832_005411 [Thelocarpon impressellum]